MAAHTLLANENYLEGNEPLLTLLSHMHMVLVVWYLPEQAPDTELVLRYMNSPAESHNQQPLHAFQGRKIDTLFPHSRQIGIPAILKEVIETGRAQVLQEVAIPSILYTQSDYFKLHLIPLPNRHLMVVGEDISERKKAENALLESEEKFATIFRESPLPTSITQLEDSTISEVNDAWCQLTGWNKQEVVNKSLDDFQFLEPDIRLELRRELLANKSIKNKELKIKCKHGDVKYVLMSVVPIRFSQTENLVNLFLDITDRKKADEELAARQEMLEKLAEQVPGVVYQFRLYPDGRSCFPYASPGIRDIYEVEPEDVQYDASKVFAKIHPDDVNMVNQEILESAKNQTIFQVDFRVVLPKKGIEWRQCKANPQRLIDGSVLWYGIITNITREVNNFNQIKKLLTLEEEQNKRMRNFTHIVSHNLRSHTANMHGIFTLLAIEHPELLNNTYIDLLQQAATNLNSTIQNLNDVLSTRYATQEDWEVKNLAQVVEDAISSVAQLAQEAEVAIHNEVPKHLEVKVIPAYLDSIVLNMITNAIKFRSADRKSYIRISTQENKQQIGLYFEDNGLGIDLERHRNNLFGMYKTFHRHRDSRGLGLFLTKSQIESLGGRIDVESEVNKGTIFKIYLPYAADK